VRWSFKIGRLAGIDIYVRLTFLLFLGWLALMYYAPSRSVADAFWGIAFILAVFDTVVLREPVVASYTRKPAADNGARRNARIDDSCSTTRIGGDLGDSIISNDSVGRLPNTPSIEVAGFKQPARERTDRSTADDARYQQI
jgi:hypothetical protein